MGGFPDALIFPESARSGRSMHERVIALSKRAESILGIDYEAGGRAYVRQATVGRIFVTSDPHDTMYFPIGSERAGEARYRWSKNDDGVEVGFLIT